MVSRPVPDILKGKLNNTQKSIQAAAWCASGAATLYKFINDTKYSLTLRRGANIGFLVTKLFLLPGCTRTPPSWTTVCKNGALTLLLLQVLIRGVLRLTVDDRGMSLTAAQIISQPIAATFGCWWHCMF